MYKKVDTKKLGRKKSHRKSLRHNLLRSLFTSTYVTTTSPKAWILKKDAQLVLERIKKNKENDLNVKRYLIDIFDNKKIVERIYEYSIKDGVSISIKKIGFRAGDNAEMSKVEIIGVDIPKRKKKVLKNKEKDITPKETKVEKKKVEENKGNKKITKKLFTVKKERSRSRSGL
jgi:ribosomal protein L17